MVVPHWAVQGDGDDFARLAADPVRGAEAPARDRAASSTSATAGRRSGSPATSRAPSGPGSTWPTIAGQRRDDPAGDRPGHPAPRRRPGDQLRHERGRRPRGDAARRSSPRPPTARPTCPAAATSPTRAATAPSRARSATPSTTRSSRSSRRSARARACPPRSSACPIAASSAPGPFADIVVFDPATFRDAATFDEPTRYAPGVAHSSSTASPLIADGELRATPSPGGKLPGRALRLQQDGPAELIIKVGRIWTGDPRRPWAEALAIRGGAIAAVGTAADVERFRGPSTRVDRPAGRLRHPGPDRRPRPHGSRSGPRRKRSTCAGVASLDEVARRVKARIDATPGDSWITGRNWDQSLWPGGAFPTAAVLDAVAPDRPVWLHRVDGHAGWANSEAMRRAKVTKDAQAPPDGQIIRDTGRQSHGRLHRRRDGPGRPRRARPRRGSTSAAGCSRPRTWRSSRA